LINGYLPEGRQSAAAIRLLSKDVEKNFSIVMQAALVHGFAIFNHKYSTLLTTIEALDSTAVQTSNKSYFKNLKYVSRVEGAEMSDRVPIATHTEIASALGLISKILGTSRSQLATVCIMYSFCQSDLLAIPAKKEFETSIKSFEIGLELFQTIAIKLT
jgi:hypothetical protein